MHKSIAAVLFVMIFGSLFILFNNLSVEFATKGVDVPALYMLVGLLAVCVLAVLGGQLYLSLVQVQSSPLVSVFACIGAILALRGLVGATYRYPALYDVQMPALVVALFLFCVLGDALFNKVKRSLPWKIGVALVLLVLFAWLAELTVNFCCSVA